MRAVDAVDGSGSSRCEPADPSRPGARGADPQTRGFRPGSSRCGPADPRLSTRVLAVRTRRPEALDPGL
eukprot:1565186-Pyramimonas_sp.AAC.1